MTNSQVALLTFLTWFNMNRKADLSIDIIIVGGSLAGLACALSLSRFGHRVVVLEKQSNVDISKMLHGGIRLPPNSTKILFDWGLERPLRQVSLTSASLEIDIYETGEFIGTHRWEQDVLRETRGEYLCAHHTNIRKVLYDAAISAGAQIRSGVTVVSIGDDGRDVKLATGERLQADVIVGADGSSSIVQREIVGKDVFGPLPYQCLLYSTTIPGALMRADPDLATFLRPHDERMYSWFGNNHSATGFRLDNGCEDEFALCFWVGEEGKCEYECWEGCIDIDEISQQLGPCDPRLIKMAKLATTFARLPIKKVPPIKNWVHDNGRVVMIGNAVHPIQAGTTQSNAMALEDAAVLAKLFSHLRTESQIPSFLHAFQDLREARCASIVQSEDSNLAFRMMTAGPHQEQRDRDMRAKAAQGESVLGGKAAAEQWELLKELYGYDAEDEADDWWIKWGVLRERARQRSLDHMEDVTQQVKFVTVQA